jgi:hypothetical protein
MLPGNKERDKKAKQLKSDAWLHVYFYFVNYCVYCCFLSFNWFIFLLLSLVFLCMCFTIQNASVLLFLYSQ